MKFGMVDFDLKMLRLKRISNGLTENYSIVTQQQWQMEIPFLLEDEGQSEINGNAGINVKMEREGWGSGRCGTFEHYCCPHPGEFDFTFSPE